MGCKMVALLIMKKKRENVKCSDFQLRKSKHLKSVLFIFYFLFCFVLF